jgi:serine/threonine protein phosphatase PrpC
MTARSRNQFGALCLGVLCLVGCAAVLLAPAPARAASAGGSRASAAPADTRPSQGAAYANPAVVRILTYYYGTTKTNDLIPVPVACAATGAIVGTATAQNQLNYVLTATSAINPLTPCEGAQAAFQQLYGPGQSWSILRIEVWLGAAYTGDSAKQLGTVRYQIDPSQVATAGGPFAPPLTTLALAPLQGAPKHDLPVIATPQPSDPPAGSTQTVLDLSMAGGQPLGRDALSPSDVPNSLEPVAVDAGQLSQEVLPTPTKPPTPTPPQQTVVGGTAVPTTAPSHVTPAASTPTQLGAELSVGAPVVDTNGSLIGMVIADSSGAHVVAPLSQVQQAIGLVSGKPGPLMQGWKQGITAYYASPANFGGAVTAFSSLHTTYADFGGVMPFLSAAKANSLDVAFGSAAASPTTTTSPGGVAGGLSLPLLLGIVGFVLFVALLVVVLVLLRSLQRGGRDRASRRKPSFGPVKMPHAPLRGDTELRPEMALPVDASPTQPQAAVSAAPVMPVMPPLPSTSNRTPTGAPGIEGGSTMVVQAVATGVVSRGAGLVPQAAGLTDPGKRRAAEPNQDNILALTGTRLVDGRPRPFGLFVVADGMGGHTDGKEASRRTVETVANHVMPLLQSDAALDLSQAASLLRDGAIKANADLRDQNLSNHADMGTTLTAALVLGDVACIANVGDSRTYKLSPDSGLQQVTTDHSVVASLVSAGVIRPEDAYTHPRRNQIYRSLGGQHEETDVDLFQVGLEPGDRLLLCSDGLWEMVRDAQIEAILRASGEPRQAAEQLIQEANKNGGEDNVSVVVVRMLDERASSGSQPGIQIIAAPSGSLHSGH